MRLLHDTVATHEHEPREGSKLVRAREPFRATSMSIDRVHNASGDDNSEFKGKDVHCKFETNCVSSPFLQPVSASRNPRQCAPGNQKLERGNP